VLVELKARFDEENNIVWAKVLERVGVHVVYGIVGLKTHTKMTLVVRRERDGIRRYVHLGTGNYNPSTSRVYTDIGLLTSDQEIGQEVVDLFNSLTGYSRKDDYKMLVVAPQRMRTELLRRIDREITVHQAAGGGHLAFKMNALSDDSAIEALYRASQAGVRVDLLVRGICFLRPGVPGLSENVRVKSIVGRFLEHSRLYWFRNGGGDDQEMLVGSADLMPRNLDHRVEVLFPVRDRALLGALRDDVMLVGLHDNTKSWELDRSGSYRKVEPVEGENPISMQDYLMAGGGAWRSA
jgi:polyphosphate kinase